MAAKTRALNYQAKIDKMNEELKNIDSAIALIKIEIPLKGSIIYRSIKCGKPKCDCQRGKNYYHGPYPHLEWIENGKVHTKYLNKKIFDKYREELEKNKKLTKLLRSRKILKKERDALEASIQKHLHKVFKIE